MWSNLKIFKTRLSIYQVIGNGDAGSFIFIIVSVLSTLHLEWVINQLIDGENYNKINPVMSNFVKKSKYDDIAERVALNGHEFDKMNYNIIQIQIYNALLKTFRK